MARGPKLHMKRLAAPKHWMVDKLSGVFAPKARAGAHSGRESLPLILVLRNRLNYALTRGEAMMITKQRLVEVDGRVKLDPKYPVGFGDVLSMPKTGKKWRLMYDVKGRFQPVAVTGAESEFKLCKVTKVFTQANSVPAICTHDGRTIRYADPLINTSDTVVVDLASGKVTDFFKFKPGVLVMVTGGANTGRVGAVCDVERHPGAFDIVHVKDANDNTFTTRKKNLFIIGKSAHSCAVTLPKANGVRIPLTQDRELRIQAVQKQRQGKKRN